MITAGDDLADGISQVVEGLRLPLSETGEHDFEKVAENSENLRLARQIVALTVIHAVAV